MTLPLSGVVAIPAQPCYNSCVQMQALCAPVFSALGLAAPPWCALRALYAATSFHPCSPAETTEVDFTAEAGGLITEACIDFSLVTGPTNGTNASLVTCPESVVFYGRKSA